MVIIPWYHRRGTCPMSIIPFDSDVPTHYYFVAVWLCYCSLLLMQCDTLYCDIYDVSCQLKSISPFSRWSDFAAWCSGFGSLYVLDPYRCGRAPPNLPYDVISLTFTTALACWGQNYLCLVWNMFCSSSRVLWYWFTDAKYSHIRHVRQIPIHCRSISRETNPWSIRYTSPNLV